MRIRTRGRTLALQILYSMAIYPDVPEGTVDHFAWIDAVNSDTRSSDQSIQFALLIIRGVRAHIDTLDSAIRMHAEHWHFDRLLEVDKAILRLSLYALIYLEDIPVAVTINEAIDLANTYSDYNSTQFVNGVLDGFVTRGVSVEHNA